MSQPKNRKEPATRAPTPSDFEKLVIGPLEEAVRLDPGNAHVHCLLAEWYARLWSMEQLPPARRAPSPAMKKKAIDNAQRAQQLDPEGRQGYVAEYEVRERFFSQMKDQRGEDQQGSERRQEHQEAAEALSRYVRSNPADPTLHYLIASAFFKAGDQARGREAAVRALECDAPSGNARMRKLTEPQRHDLERWLKQSPAS
jgi:hypothetical protein